MTNYLIEASLAGAVSLALIAGRHDPCGSAAEREATTALDHMRAIGNHLRALSRHAVDLCRRNDTGGGSTPV